MGSTILTPKDFKTLPKDGIRFENLICHLLEAMEYHILEKPAIGCEGGRDILVERLLKDAMTERRERVVVQCKHYVHSGKAIGDNQVGIWQNAMTRHKARGYLLITDTRVTENLSRSFREYTQDEINFPNWASFWDVDDLIVHLNKYPKILSSFFPLSPIKQSPIQNLAQEIQICLSAINYKVNEPNWVNEHCIDMIAKLDEGPFNQNVLIRCVGGEITQADVEDLEGELNLEISQGWIISDKRISQQARLFSDSENIHVKVFGLSDFLKEKIWGMYFGQLQVVVQKNRIPEFYVNPGCNKQIFDNENNEIGIERHASLDEYIDSWLKERGKIHLSLLGEFGSGKTWFCYHYAYCQLERYLNDPANQRLPLLITLKTFAKSMSSQQLINEMLLEQYKLPFFGSAYEVFKNMNQHGKLLLILDGFDEMARKVDYQTVVDNFWELANLIDDNSKVILSA